ncbi:hypothetical protein W02_16680 [Nitrospira sp. KM1]|uniref:hypothetical protein n=1 Tax=Nitrospira sp. KM1 TaxID=1936990 RepID=UPI0013A7123E|nr:hypothetical protein [Nitrospira sp. KM1]BCA54528.1 hypothetical protein W02_16680 [Nitrospira sp. KM1]
MKHRDTPQESGESRRTLLQAAALGDEIAQQMLKLEYQTKDYSPVERVNPPIMNEFEAHVDGIIAKILLTSVVMMVLLVCPPHAMGEVSSAREEGLHDMENVLKQAAIEPQSDQTQRDVHDITFLLEQSLKSADKADHTRRKEYAKEALRLLRHSAAQGSLNLDKATPVLTLLNRLLRDRSGSLSLTPY